VPQNPHDALFKLAFSEPENAAVLLRHALPDALTLLIDWASLRREPGSFVDERLSERRSDLLFSVQLGGREAFVYVLLEHQSGSDPLMAFRLLRYVVRVTETWLRDHPDAQKLPPVVPLVIHHSASGWTAARQFMQLLDLDSESLAVLGPHLPQLQFLLDDLSAADDAQLRARSHEAFALLTLRLLVHARHSADLLAKLRHWRQTFEQVLNAPNGVAALAALMMYIMEVGEAPPEALSDFFQQLGPAASEAFMTTAQQLTQRVREEARNEGKAEGKAEGKVELVLRLLTRQFGDLPENVVQRVRQASSEKLDLLFERALNASTLEDVLSPND
jgi:predicted transposase/invertase (TIGR01784 family)